MLSLASGWVWLKEKNRNSNNLYLTPHTPHVLLSKQFRPFLLPVTGQQLRTIFFLEKYKMMPCLPLKTGTTNWQRSLISLLYVDDSGTPRLDPNDVVKVINAVKSKSKTDVCLRRISTKNCHDTQRGTISSYSNAPASTRPSCPVCARPCVNALMTRRTQSG